MPCLLGLREKECFRIQIIFRKKWSILCNCIPLGKNRKPAASYFGFYLKFSTAAATARGKEVSHNFIAEIRSALAVVEPKSARSALPDHVVVGAGGGEGEGKKGEGRSAYFCTICQKTFKASTMRYKFLWSSV